MKTDTNSNELLKTFLRDVTQKNKLNETLEAYLGNVTPLENLRKNSEVPFSSERKYSACIYEGFSLVLGAPEMLLSTSDKALKIVKDFTRESYRVVVFGKVNGKLDSKSDIKKDFKPLLVIALDDPIREETPGTLEKLSRENISYRIISGDSPDTVAAIARKINKNLDIKVVNGEDLDRLQGQDLEKAILSHNIFARIKPHQKQLIIRTLKKNKLFTIMIGDGVNDVLALKESDLGVAMNGGSSMAKDVADVVLLNNSFATLPTLLYEGRRIITNIQTIANIYLMKNISSIAAILMLGFIGLRFPFEPEHVELSSVLIIGIPSFVLAFEKHTFSTTDEGFIKRLLFFSGVVGFGNAILYTVLYMYFDLTSQILFYSRTMLLVAVIFLGINNIILIYLQHYTIGEIIRRKIVIGLVFTVLLLFAVSMWLPLTRTFFKVAQTNFIDLLIVFSFTTIGSFVIANILGRLKLLKSQESLIKQIEEAI